MPDVAVLDHDAVLAAVTPEAAIDAVRDGFGRHRRGEWVMPSKTYLHSPPHGDFRAMPARGGDLAMLKWISSFPGNPAQGLPTVMGVVCVSDARTSELLALLDAGAVTALRTGAVAAIAARALAARGRGDGRADRLRAARRVGGALPGRRGLRPRRLRRPGCRGRGLARARARVGDRHARGGAGLRRRHLRDARLRARRHAGRPAPGDAPEHARRRRPGQGGGRGRTRWPPAGCSATSGTRPPTAAS